MLNNRMKKYFCFMLQASRFKLIACGLQRLACSILFLSIFWILCFAQDQFTYDAKGKRNPFIPLVTPDGRLLKLEKEEGASEVLLEGIIYDKYGLSYAIVNAGVVKIGDKIGNYQVLKIEENKVIFIKDGQPIEMELNPVRDTTNSANNTIVSNGVKKGEE